MAQWFKMSYAFHRCGNGFLIYNISGSELHSHMEAFPDEMFQNLNLHLPHQHGMDFPQLLIPHNVKLRFFLFQLFQAFQHLVGIAALRKDDLIIQHRLQNRHDRLSFNAQSFSRIGLSQTCNRADGSCLRFFDHLKLRTGINADLIDLFFPAVHNCLRSILCKVGFLLTLLLSCYSGQCIFYLQSSGCHFQIRQPAASWISGYLENFRAKITCISICAIYLFILFNITSHPIHEFLYAFHLQRRTKITRICFPVTDYLSNCILFYFL